MKKILFILVILSTLISCNRDDNQLVIDPDITVTDIDGNIYTTITIGNQVWMGENLKTTTFTDGTPINKYKASPGQDWWNGNNPIAYYQWADTPPGFAADDFGALYNYWAIESGKLAPEGWRIPTTQDFIELENYLANNGYAGVEGEALKSTTGWGPMKGTDAIGFKGFPNGYVHTFGGVVPGICTWATSEVIGEFRSVINLFDTTKIMYHNNGRSLGAGIRCIKEKQIN